MEDNAADVYLIREAIALAGVPVDVVVASDGEQAVASFDSMDRDPTVPCPSLVILDINLPRKHGGEVLRYMRTRPRCGRARVVIVSTSNSARDRQEMMALGADRYFAKPSSYEAFLKLSDIVRALLGDAASPPGEPDA